MDTFKTEFLELTLRNTDRNVYCEREEALQSWRKASTEDLEFWSPCIPWDNTARQYMKTLNSLERTFCIRVGLLVWTATNYTLIPRKVQLEASLALLYKKDSLFYSGTGSGKTMFMAIALLLLDPSENGIVITISPLKRLQASQEQDFNERYGIPTLAINEDTPRDNTFFRENVYDTQRSKIGRVWHFVITPEQLFVDTLTGHLPVFGRTLLHNAGFRSKIRHIIVDECHTIHTAGLELNGEPAFRPSWGALDTIKARLSDSICWHGMTATLPDHMLKTVAAKILKPGYRLTVSTSNRKNIVYATHPVVNSLEDMRNYRCFLKDPYDDAKQPLVLLFFDSKDLAIRVQKYLQGLLPSATKEDRVKYDGIVQVYYSDLSKTSLAITHGAFTREGKCRILCSTSGLSQGVDFSQVDIIVSVGLPPSIVEVIQRGGRAGRQDRHRSIFITFYEPWALEISLDEFAGGDLSDPDRTRKPLNSKCTKQDRATYSSVEFVQRKSCLRYYFSCYLGDKALNALEFVTTHCCPFHDDSFIAEEVFNLQGWLPGLLFTLEQLEVEASNERKAEAAARARNRYRLVAEREQLDNILIEWVTETAADASLNHGYFNPDDILPSHTRQAIITLLPATYQKQLDDKPGKRLMGVIDESNSWHHLWSEEIIEILCEYDYETDEESELEEGNTNSGEQGQDKGEDGSVKIGDRTEESGSDSVIDESSDTASETGTSISEFDSSY